MNGQLQQKIQQYLADEDKLYQDWYKEVYYVELEPDMEQVAPFPSKEELKMRFKAWYESRVEKLKIIFIQEINGETLCKGWQQLRKKDPEHIVIHLVGHVSITGTGHLLGVDLEGISLTMTILVINGYVDRLCDSKMDK